MQEPEDRDEQMSRGVQTAWIVGAIVASCLVIVALIIHYNRDPRYLECAGFFGPDTECRAAVAMRNISRLY